MNLSLGTSSLGLGVRFRVWLQYVTTASVVALQAGDE